jgi:hypothetical protein
VIAVAILSAAIGSTRHDSRATPYVAAGIVVLIFVCGPIYLWWAVRHWDTGGGGPKDGEGDGEGGDGGGRRGGRTPPKGSPDTDPEWWPEFERQFSAHVLCDLDARDDLMPASK